MACNLKLTSDILYNCADAPKKGIDGGKAVLINWDDIDFAGSTVTDSIISDLILKTGTTGYSLSWYKDLASANSAFAPNTEDIDGFLHNFLARMPTTSADHANRANELKAGRFIIVYESKYKGALSVEAFKVRGWNAGLKLTEMTENTLEKSGSILFTLGTEDGDTEEYPYNIFLETDYATSAATFATLFAPVV